MKTQHDLVVDKKRVLLDVDGVVADFSGSLLRAIDSSLRPEDITDWNIFKLIEEADGKASARLALSLMDNPRHWQSAGLLPGALQAVEGLKQRGATIYWVTSPWPTCHGWDTARRLWLKQYFGGGDGFVITESKYLCAGDIFIDDRPENVQSWAKAHPDKQALLFDAPYNRNSALPRLTWSQHG